MAAPKSSNDTTKDLKRASRPVERQPSTKSLLPDARESFRLRNRIRRQVPSFVKDAQSKLFPELTRHFGKIPSVKQMVSHDTDKPSERYTLSARVLHWAMALGFFFMWACGYAMTTLVADDSPLQEFLFGLHISVGVTLLLLLIPRVAVRVLWPPPPLPSVLSKWEQVGSHLGHWGLYLLPAAVIVVGWAETDFGGHGVEWFGVPMPKVFPNSETLFGVKLETATATLHMWLAYAMLALALVHVAAVAKHRWIDRHDVLYRMTFGKRKGR